MVSLGIPKTAVIGNQAAWVTLLDSYSSADFDSYFTFDATEVTGAAQLPPQAGWKVSTDFEWGSLGVIAWSLSVRDKIAPFLVTEVATGKIFLETPEYSVIRQQVEAADAAILKILQGGGNQSISIKGRSTTKYGLADMRGLRSQLNSQLNRMLQGSGASQVLVDFGR